MALHVSPISRNLAMKVTFMFLELEDMLGLGLLCAVAMVGGNFLFSDRYVFGIPMNWFLVLTILCVGIPSLMLFKYGKPRKYMVDLLLWHGKPQTYCAHARDTKLDGPYLQEEQ